jgi:hypothetical protein
MMERVADRFLTSLCHSLVLVRTIDLFPCILLNQTKGLKWSSQNILKLNE